MKNYKKSVYNYKCKQETFSKALENREISKSRGNLHSERRQSTEKTKRNENKGNGDHFPIYVFLEGFPIWFVLLKVLNNGNKTTFEINLLIEYTIDRS